MVALVSAFVSYPFSWLRRRHDLALENLALRHQIAVLKRRTCRPPSLPVGRCVWVMLKSCWPSRKAALMIFQPKTVTGWRRGGLRMFWRWKSNRRLGRPGKDAALIQLIRRMWQVNHTWGSPRIRDELAKLGLQVSTAMIRKCRPKSSP